MIDVSLQVRKEDFSAPKNCLNHMFMLEFFLLWAQANKD